MITAWSCAIIENRRIQICANQIVSKNRTTLSADRDVGKTAANDRKAVATIDGNCATIDGGINVFEKALCESTTFGLFNATSLFAFVRLR
jgi:hypothetical protein